ncbi:MAG: hypothetical protein II366_03115 [Clostridia bacterium]|nr:hypothetical protein [Clostridia bacterium]
MKMLVEAIEQHKPFFDIAVLVVGFVSIALITYCLEWIFYNYAHDIVNHRFIQYFNTKIFKKAGNVELSCYEDSAFYNKYTRALDRTPERIMNVYSQTLTALGQILRVVVLLVVMITIDYGVALFLIFPLIGNFVFGKLINDIDQKKYKENTRHNRIIGYDGCCTYNSFQKK